MTKRKPAISTVALAALAVAGLIAAHAGIARAADPAPPAPPASMPSGPMPVVAELFTSQGCYSCPPADRYLGALAKQKGVIALSHHVDYWNYLGWKDPFSRKDATVRQRAYAWAMRRPSVYTPQIVINGRYQTVGSHSGRVAALVRRAAAARVALVAVTLRRLSDGALALSVAPGAGKTVELANIWLVLFDKARTTAIPRGENAGKRLTYHHVVREMRMVGDYTGKAVSQMLTAKGADGSVRYGAAVLVQLPRAGAIVGAAVALATAGATAAK